MSGTDGNNKKNAGILGGLLNAGALPPPPRGLGFGALPPSQRGILSTLLDRPEVNNLYYNGKQVTLDGYTFIGCRFDNCTLHLSTSNFNLIRCVIDSTTTIVYGSSALKVIQLFNSRYPWAYENLKPFVPTVNADGTITISDSAG